MRDLRSWDHLASTIKKLGFIGEKTAVKASNTFNHLMEILRNWGFHHQPANLREFRDENEDFVSKVYGFSAINQKNHRK